MKLPRILRPPRPAAPLVVSGVLLGLAFPPFHLLGPSFLALVPWAMWTARLPAGPEGRSVALRGGYLLGLIYFSLVFYWLVVALIFYTPLAVLAFALPVLIMSGFLAVATLGIQQSVRRVGLPVWAAVPIFWTATEWLRAQLGDVAFPWMGLGDSLTGYPALIGAADVVGSRGLSLWLALVAGLVAEMLLRRRPAWTERWLPDPRAEAGPEPAGPRAPAPGPPGASGDRLAPIAVALLVVLAIPTSYSVWRWHALETRPAARVGIVQPNIPEDLKLDRLAGIDSAMSSVRNLVGREFAGADGVPDVVLLPETTFPAPIPLDPPAPPGWRDGPDVVGFVERTARRAGAPVLYGAIGTEALPDDELRYYNSAFLRDRSGRRLGAYHKRELVPVVERVPFVDPAWFQGGVADALGDYFGGYGIGPEPELMSAGGARFGVLVCYESIFTDLSRSYRTDGADFLVNVTNDAWYGREQPFWSQTSALWQHPAHMVMRAVENRVGVARSANTGISMVIDPRGRQHRRTELFRPAAFTATVRTSSEVTVYARHGDVAGWAAALAALGVALASGIGRRRGDREPA